MTHPGKPLWQRAALVIAWSAALCAAAAVAWLMVATIIAGTGP